MMKVHQVNHSQHIANSSKKKVNKGDEKIVRNALVKEWTKIMEHYVASHAALPSVEHVRQQLIKSGTDASIKALQKEHWFYFDFAIRDTIKTRIDKELHRFNLEDVLEDVRYVQQHPQDLGALREKIRHNIIEN